MGSAGRIAAGAVRLGNTASAMLTNHRVLGLAEIRPAAVLGGVCLAIAIGPDRLGSWIGRNVATRHDVDESQPAGWIEEDGHPVE